MIAVRDTTIEGTRARAAGGGHGPAPTAVPDVAEAPRADEPVSPASPRSDALAPLLARAVQDRAAGDAGPGPLSEAVLQRYVVSPLPRMTSQVGRGMLGIVDLNAGWYCMVAAMTHHMGRPLGMTEAEAKLPNAAWFGYDPQLAGTLATSIAKPTSLEAWEARLRTVGPIIVTGKLGAMDWGFLGGVEHNILIVGADAKEGTFTFMDPLKGNDELSQGSYAQMNERINDHGLYAINSQGLKALFPEDFAPNAEPAPPEPEQPELADVVEPPVETQPAEPAPELPTAADPSQPAVEDVAVVPPVETLPPGPPALEVPASGGPGQPAPDERLPRPGAWKAHNGRWRYVNRHDDYGVELPEGYRYTRNHLWARKEDDGTLTMGLTELILWQAYAPQIRLTSVPSFRGHQRFGQLRGVLAGPRQVEARTKPRHAKSTFWQIDLFCDIPGTVVEENPYPGWQELYGRGWLFKLKPKHADSFDRLMSCRRYFDLCRRYIMTGTLVDREPSRHMMLPETGGSDEETLYRRWPHGVGIEAPRFL